ncbi:phosphonopyruvate decarboxylase [Bradyrhizobium sp.]|uniref:phosphonopyruvate decarboxylase n=1 Tax=Bradyrhizobium sp. TaxID=376 RepID=UPI002C34EE99|nr:phosphonopyruvate decarboxylase [Bradyrhizobium sp.]HMM89332.1 thiamine pyrophosphate-binding protein [Bradyrhizobium sp.]
MTSTRNSDSPTSYPPQASWTDQVYQALKDFGVKQVPYLPDGSLAPLIDLCREDSSMRAIPLTTEEEGVMLLAGAWLGGDRSALLMQCGGVGNCVNMFSLLTTCTFPAVMVVTMRGVWGEFNPWQVPMGKATRGCFELFGFSIYSLTDASRAGETMRAALQHAFGGNERVVLLVEQSMLGAKSFQN